MAGLNELVTQFRVSGSNETIQALKTYNQVLGESRKQLSDLSGALSAYEQRMRASNERLRSTSNLLLGMGSALTGVVALSVKSAATYEQSMKRMIVATKGNVVAAKTYYQLASKFAGSQGQFSRQDVMFSTQRMVMSGMNPRRLLPAFGQVAGEMKAQIGEVFGAYRMATLGRPMTLTRRFGINPAELVALGAPGKKGPRGTTLKMPETAEEAKAAEQAFIKLANTRFAGGLEAETTSLSGKLQQLNNVIQETHDEFGKVSTGPLAVAVDQAKALLQWVNGWPEGLKKAVFWIAAIGGPSLLLAGTILRLLWLYRNIGLTCAINSAKRRVQLLEEINLTRALVDLQKESAAAGGAPMVVPGAAKEAFKAEAGAASLALTGGGWWGKTRAKAGMIWDRWSPASSKGALKVGEAARKDVEESIIEAARKRRSRMIRSTAGMNEHDADAMAKQADQWYDAQVKVAERKGLKARWSAMQDYYVMKGRTPEQANAAARQALGMPSKQAAEYLETKRALEGKFGHVPELGMTRNRRWIDKRTGSFISNEDAALVKRLQRGVEGTGRAVQSAGVARKMDVENALQPFKKGAAKAGESMQAVGQKIKGSRIGPALETVSAKAKGLWKNLPNMLRTTEMSEAAKAAEVAASKGGMLAKGMAFFGKGGRFFSSALGKVAGPLSLLLDFAQTRNEWKDQESGKSKITTGSILWSGARYAMSGAMAGSAIPGLGTLAGGIIGGITGIFAGMWTGIKREVTLWWQGRHNKDKELDPTAGDHGDTQAAETAAAIRAAQGIGVPGYSMITAAQAESNLARSDRMKSALSYTMESGSVLPGTWDTSGSMRNTITKAKTSQQAMSNIWKVYREVSARAKLDLDSTLAKIQRDPGEKTAEQIIEEMQKAAQESFLTQNELYNKVVGKQLELMGVAQDRAKTRMADALAGTADFGLFQKSVDQLNKISKQRESALRSQNRLLEAEEEAYKRQRDNLEYKRQTEERSIQLSTSVAQAAQQDFAFRQSLLGDDKAVSLKQQQALKLLGLPQQGTYAQVLANSDQISSAQRRGLDYAMPSSSSDSSLRTFLDRMGAVAQILRQRGDVAGQVSLSQQVAAGIAQFEQKKEVSSSRASTLSREILSTGGISNLAEVGVSRAISGGLSGTIAGGGILSGASADRIRASASRENERHIKVDLMFHAPSNLLDDVADRSMDTTIQVIKKVFNGNDLASRQMRP